QPLQSLYPGQHILDTAFQRWWKPTCRARPVIETRFAVTGLPVSSAPANPAPFQQLVSNGLTSMLDFRCPDDDHTAFEFRCHRTPAALAARINLDCHWLRLTTFPFFQNDRERIAPEDGGFPRFEQRSRSCRMAGHQRLPMTIYYKNSLQNRYLHRCRCSPTS